MPENYIGEKHLSLFHDLFQVDADSKVGTSLYLKALCEDIKFKFQALKTFQLRVKFVIVKQFTRQIHRYASVIQATVKMYLTKKRQVLKLPELIYRCFRRYKLMQLSKRLRCCILLVQSFGRICVAKRLRGKLVLRRKVNLYVSEYLKNHLRKEIYEHRLLWKSLKRINGHFQAEYDVLRNQDAIVYDINARKLQKWWDRLKHLVRYRRGRDAIQSLQVHYRDIKGREAARLERKSIIIQRWWSRCLPVLQWQRLRHSTRYLQNLFRMAKHRVAEKVERSVALLQGWWKARKEMHHLKLNRKASLLQTWWNVRRLVYLLKLNAKSRVIQEWWRARRDISQHKLRLRRTLRAIRTVQKSFRSRNRVTHFKHLYERRSSQQRSRRTSMPTHGRTTSEDKSPTKTKRSASLSIFSKNDKNKRDDREKKMTSRRGKSKLDSSNEEVVSKQTSASGATSKLSGAHEGTPVAEGASSVTETAKKPKKTRSFSLFGKKGNANESRDEHASRKGTELDEIPEITEESGASEHRKPKKTRSFTMFGRKNKNKLSSAGSSADTDSGIPKNTPGIPPNETSQRMLMKVGILNKPHEREFTFQDGKYFVRNPHKDSHKGEIDPSEVTNITPYDVSSGWFTVTVSNGSKKKVHQIRAARQSDYDFFVSQLGWIPDG